MKTMLRENTEFGIRLWLEQRHLGPVYSISADDPLPEVFMPNDNGDRVACEAAFDRIVTFKRAGSTSSQP